MNYLNKLNSIFLAIGLFIAVGAFSTNSINKEKHVLKRQLPQNLIGTYEGTLTKLSGKTIVNPEGTCTIKKGSRNTYNLHFSNGLTSIRNVRFTQDDEIYTATALYSGKKLGITIDSDDNSLSIGSISGSKVLAFEGDLISSGTYSNVNLNTQHQSISTKGDNTKIRNGNQTITTKGNSTNIKNGNQRVKTRRNGSISIKTGDLGIDASNGNVSIVTGNGSIHVNDGETHIDNNESLHVYSGNAFYECESNQIADLPEQVVGIYMGTLEAPGVHTKKGICKIVQTGCKTYRLDFSNGIPSIHGVQFGRMNNFKEFTSVVIEREYATEIEIDMRFDDLNIERGLVNVVFDGEKQ